MMGTRTFTLVIAAMLALPISAVADDDEAETRQAPDDEAEPPKPKKKKKRKKPVEEAPAQESAPAAAAPATEVIASAPADEQPRRFALSAELLGASPVDGGNRDLFGVGGGASLGTDVYLHPMLDVHGGVTFVALTKGDGMSSTSLIAGHIGPRVHLGSLLFGPATRKDLWVDAHYSYGTSGGIRRPGFDAGAALQWEVSPAVRIGPVVRYQFGIDPRDNHAQLFTVGVAVGIGRRSRIAAVAPPPDRDGDGIVDGGDACPDDPETDKPDPKRPGCPTDDQDADGLADADDRCPLEAIGDKPDPSREGCPFTDRDRDGIADLYDKCPSEAGPPNVFEPSKHGCGELARVANNKIEILQQIFFETDSAAIKEESFPVLEAVAKILAGMPDTRVRIEGHTDDVGTAEHNLDLSKRRARSVATWLIQSGNVDASRLETEGYGKTRPIVQSSSAENPMNRRVEFVILAPAPTK